MRMKKGRWLHRLAVALGTAAAAVMLTQVPAAARDLICKEDTTYKINATEIRTVDFYKRTDYAGGYPEGAGKAGDFSSRQWHA